MLDSPSLRSTVSGSVEVERERVLLNVYEGLWGLDDDSVNPLHCDELLHSCALLYPVDHDVWQAFKQLRTNGRPQHWLSVGEGWRVVAYDPKSSFCVAFCEVVYPGSTLAGGLALVGRSPNPPKDSRVLSRLWVIALRELERAQVEKPTHLPACPYTVGNGNYYHHLDLSAGEYDKLLRSKAQFFFGRRNKRSPPLLVTQRVQLARELEVWGDGMRAAACLVHHFQVKVPVGISEEEFLIHF